MRFLVDAQLPPVLARWLTANGHEADHVADRGMAAAKDTAIWNYALANDIAIDVLVELEIGRSISLFELMGIELRLREIFGRKVDVVSKRGLRPQLDDSIVADAVAAF